MINPDCIPWQIGIPVALILWAWVALPSIARRRRARRVRQEPLMNTEPEMRTLAEGVAKEAERVGIDLIGIVLIEKEGATVVLERDPVNVVVDSLIDAAEHLAETVATIECETCGSRLGVARPGHLNHHEDGSHTVTYA